MKHKINNHREYELYIKHEVAKLQVSNKFKSAVRKLAMRAFEDGLRMTQGKLEVDV